MDPSAGGPVGGEPRHVLSALAAGLSADVADVASKSLDVIRVRSPDLVRHSDEAGEDMMVSATDFIQMLLTSLQTEVEQNWEELERKTRDYGRAKAAQGAPLETLLDVFAAYRRATVELITRPLEGSPRRDEIFALAQSRLEDVVERLNASTVRGYLDHLDAEHRSREGELYGLAAIVTAMGPSLDVAETAAVALVEMLAALRLTAGALWLRVSCVFAGEPSAC